MLSSSSSHIILFTQFLFCLPPQKAPKPPSFCFEMFSGFYFCGFWNASQQSSGVAETGMTGKYITFWLLQSLRVVFFVLVLKKMYYNFNESFLFFLFIFFWRRIHESECESVGHQNFFRGHNTTDKAEPSGFFSVSSFRSFFFLLR